MKIKSLELEATAVKESQYPPEGLVEFALAGRSNVGKSSFLNALLGRKNLARTSGKPGKTRTINFYKVNNKIRITDLPGYGYAQASKKDQEAWARSINEYLEVRESLAEVILLVDIRHAPSKEDVAMYSWIRENNFAGLVVATKADKVSKGKRAQALALIKKTLQAPSLDLIVPYSSQTRENISEIWAIIEDMASFHEEEG